MRGWGERIAWLVRAVLVMVVVLLGLWVFRAPTLGDNSMVGRATIAALGFAVVVALLTGLPGLGRAPVRPQETEQAARQLRDAALNRLENEAGARGITGAGQLPVGWRWAASDVAVPAERMNPSFRGPTSGLVTDLFLLYRSLDPNWKRLVILGGPGSGKTAAMTLLLLKVLRDRQPDEPVPVWITLGSWNPTEESLRHYAAAVIGRDFPSTFGQGAAGNAGATALLDGRQVALFLDGLDEMPPGLQADAAKLINQERTLPIVMTSRYPEYTSATTHIAFDGAIIEMAPLTINQTIKALETGQRADRATVWQAFTDKLSSHASGMALWTSPLIVSLLRQTYETAGNPCELLDAQKFPDDDAIRAALIERVLDQAYPDPKAREYATHWLTWIATNLKDTRDIGWWYIPRWTPGRQLVWSVPEIMEA